MDALPMLWEQLVSHPHLKAWLTLAWLLYLVPLCIWIILQKREPVATLSWLMSLALLPYLGYLVYFLLGPQKIKRQRLRRDRSRDLLQRQRIYASADPEAVELATLAQATTGLAPSAASDVQLLIDGAATYAAILEAIEQATDHVHLEYYIFTPDQTGTRLRDALIERARAGIKVRLLLDAVGSSKVNRRFLAPLQAAGAEFCWFHPTQFRLFTRPWLNLRTHRKIVIVDGRVGFTGGINVTDEENEALRDDAYRDLHLRMVGPVVRSLQQVFVEDWAYACGQDQTNFDGTRLWPPLAAPASAASIPAQVLVSGPDSSWEAIHRMHVAAIHEARHRVWLVTPYFVPGEAARMALTSAALGGLDVRLLVPRRSDSLLVTLAARSYFDELLAAGVKIHEYGPRMLHSKALLCDDDLALIGSANFDHRSFRLNFEVSVLFRDPGVAAGLAALIQDELAAARLLPAQARTGQRWYQRLPEALARLLSPLL